MKKYALTLALIFGLLSLASAAWWSTEEYDPIQISESGSIVGSTSSYVYTLSKPTSAREKYCFRDITISATNAPNTWAFSILQGGLTSQTTAFMVDIATTPYRMSWPNDYPLCLIPGSTGYFRIEGSSAVWKLNATGFIKK